ncbi:MAG: type VI secretion system ATPase TssH, partial [Planctomycetes bacterium]|nr:type VI secretion system ATPase TssH [Planctomycetota bacterium]
IGDKPASTALARYTIDFTAQAKAGKIDPVFGRDNEIRQLIDILARRRKNNPIAVGEAGVGKTAVVEGLALRVAEGDVPPALQGVSILGLDLGLLQAGASVKGEFETRLKGVIEEIKASPTPIILFIDEAHTLIGAGGQAGTGDAANLLKPALARGELRTIAATTWSEYKKYIEKDPALARRFQLVKLDEPSVAVATLMLRGVKERFEKAHGVIIRDDAIVACAELGGRYISGRQHPDKGVDLMDTAAARVKIALSTKPGALEDVERRIQAVERELAALGRDRHHGASSLDGRIDGLEAEIAAARIQRDAIDARWREEKAAADAVIAVRARLAPAAAMVASAGSARTAIKSGNEAAVRVELEAAMASLRKLQGKDPLVHIEVTPEVVAQVVSDWTGIPLGKMVSDQAASLLQFESQLGERIKGQGHALEIVGTGIRAAKAGLKNPEAPMGVFLFVGPSGVGKTETALGVADLLFGGERFMTTINMSEFMEKHAISRLIGSPPGYVGYGEGGVLTEAVRQRPYSVVLLDEVEKADPEVLNLFYQVFDKGALSDGEGRTVDFKDTVIFLTSNLATDLITEAGTRAERPGVDELVDLIRPTLSRHFKPALLARMTIVPFYPVTGDALRSIAALKIDRLRRRLLDSHKITLTVAPAALDAIVARCTEVETGARNVDHILSGTLLPRISSEILGRMADGPLPERMMVDLAPDGTFRVAFPAL